MVNKKTSTKSFAKGSKKIRKKPLVNQIDCSIRNLIRLIFIGFSGIIFIYQIVSIFNQYNRYQIKIEKTFASERLIKTPHFTFCFKLVAVLNTTIIFNQSPEILRKVEHISRTNKYFRNHSYHEIIHDHTQVDRMIYKRFSTAQLINSVVSIPALIRPCVKRTSNLSIVICSKSSWIKTIFSKSFCITQHYNQRYQFSRTIFDGFGNIPLAFFRFNLTSLPLVEQVAVSAHSSGTIPWYSGNQFVYLKVKSNHFDEYALAFTKTVTKSLPKPYIDDCQHNKLPPCYNKCLIGQFVKQVKAYPREYTVKMFKDDERLIDNYSEEFEFYNLSLRLYKECALICGHTPCSRIDYHLKLLRPQKRYHYPGKVLDVTFYPSKKTTLLIERKPVLPLANLISSFGGLMGIWFGLSFYTLIQYFLNYITSQLNKFYFHSDQPIEIEIDQLTPSVDCPKTINKYQSKVFVPVKCKTINLLPKPHYLTRVNAF